MGRVSRVYLDWNATTPLRPEAKAAMIAAMDPQLDPRNWRFVLVTPETAPQLLGSATSRLAVESPELGIARWAGWFTRFRHNQYRS